MNISWLFEIDTYKWSTKDVVYSGTDYSAKVFPETFGGISMGWDIAGGGLIYPSDLEFEIDNADSAITRADLEGEYCTVKLITDGSLTRTWKFEVQTAILSYRKIRIYCFGILQKYLEGDYPNTPHPREVWVSANHQPEDGKYDNYRIPVIFGTAYIPLMYIYRNSDSTGYYVLGDDTIYTIDEVTGPPESSRLTWTSGSYTFNQSSDAGYKLAEFVIAYDPAGYTEGTWPSGQKPLVKYSKTSGSTTAPATILSTILQDFGVPSGDIDTAGTWATAATLFGTQSITWNGGFYEVQNREQLLSDLLVQCDSTLYVSDKIELIPFSKTSKETFDTTKTKKLSYRPTRITKTISDSGHIAWAEDGYPQNILSGKALVPINATTADPDKETFNLKFINDDVVAQKLGILHFQRKLATKDSISFSTVGSVMDTLATLKPADVITVDDPLLGGTQDMIISEISILPDLTVNISGRSYSILQEFSDLSPSAIVVPEDPSDPTLGAADSVYVYGPNVFKFLTGSATPVTSPITLTAVLSGDLSTYDWEYWTGAAWSNLSGTQTSQTYSLAYDNAAWGASTTLRIRCLSGTIFDEMTITKIYDGDAGADGADGVDAGNWSSTLVFTSVDYNTVSWNSHVISTFSNGSPVNYSISAGNTGNMSPATAYYMYLKPSVSTTVLQVTTTASAAVGAGQILVGVAFPNSVTTIKAQFQAFGGRGGVFINADNIAANCIAADKIVANSITGNEINVSTHIAFDTVGKISYGVSTNYIIGTSSTIGIHAGSYVQAYFNAGGGITLNAAQTYMDIDLNAGDAIWLNAGGNVKIDWGTYVSDTSGVCQFQNNGVTQMFMKHNGLFPSNDNQELLGFTSFRWAGIYTAAIYDANSAFDDTFDDLYEISQFKPRKKLIEDKTTGKKAKGEPYLNPDTGGEYLDLYSLPKRLTNYYDVVTQLKKDCCDRIEDSEIDDLIADYEEAGWMLSRNLGAISSLTEGAIRAKMIEDNEMYELIFSKITDIETRLKKLGV